MFRTSKIIKLNNIFQVQIITERTSVVYYLMIEFNYKLTKMTEIDICD